MRTVFNSADVIHRWAHSSQQHARNSQGNVSFEGRTLFSYREPIAAIYGKPKDRALSSLPDGAKLVLFRSRSFSVTTSSHQSAARHAANHLRSVHVPRIDGFQYSDAPKLHAANLKYIEHEMSECAASAARVQHVRNVEWKRDAWNRLSEDRLTYAAFFGLKRKALAPPDWAAMVAKIEKRLNDPRRSEKLRKAQEAREVARAAKQAREVAEWVQRNAENIARWRAGQYHGPLWGVPCMLRLSGDAILTSQGASFPAEHARRAWPLLVRLHARGEEFTPDQNPARFQRLRFGPYAVDRIDADGTLHAGCHTIAWDELERCAVLLGLKEDRPRDENNLAPDYQPD